ncbi:hypothetical protein E2C01_027384 [Portunus trituberculatus]|uniref:Uncharacterized protein n=1 Tax=Portunus trituberculatus TaxID=210409 RepID=A0A5B7EIK8_PORTR|nr:hypothetical protein [Portunus trituberculatus]
MLRQPRTAHTTKASTSVPDVWCQSRLSSTVTSPNPRPRPHEGYLGKGYPAVTSFIHTGHIGISVALCILLQTYLLHQLPTAELQGARRCITTPATTTPRATRILTAP